MKQAWRLTVVFIAVFTAIGMAQVSIISPRDGETIRSRRLNLKVEKPTQEGYVMIWLDGKFLTAVTAPFDLRIDLADQKIFSGLHTIKVAGFNRLGQKEGESQIQVQVQLVGEEVENLRLIFKPRTGELAFYTFQASSEATVDIPARALRQKVPQLSTKLTLRWFQTVRDITADRQFRMMRGVEDGVLEKESLLPSAGTPMMGGQLGQGMTGPMGMLGGMPGGEAGPGMPSMGIGPPGLMMGAPGAPTMLGVAGLTIGPFRLRLRPVDSQKFALFVLLPNGSISSSEDIPNVVKFASGSVNITLPEEVLKVGRRWVGFVTLPRNLENLTIIGAPTGGMLGMGGAPMMGGFPGGEETSGMLGMMPSAPVGPLGRSGTLSAPMGPGGMTPPLGLPFALQEPEAFLADAPVVDVPASHRLDGFEYWNDKLCARIVSEFKNVTVELDLMPTAGMGQVGPAGMYGALGMPGMMGGQMGQMTPGGQMPSSPMGPFGPGTMGQPSTPSPAGQPQQPQTKLKGTAEGTRTLLFDIENGQVVYVKVTMKVNFDTDFATVMPFVQVQQQFAGAPSATPGMPSGQMGSGFGGSGGESGAGIGGAPFFGTPWGGGFYTGAPFGGTPFGGGPLGVGPFGGGPFGGNPFGVGGTPFGGAPFGGTPFGGPTYGGIGGTTFGFGTPTSPNPFGRFGMGAFGPAGPSAPGGFGLPSPGVGAPGVPGAPQQQVTFRNYPAKLAYSLTLENILTHSGRLDQQLKTLLGAR